MNLCMYPIDQTCTLACTTPLPLTSPNFVPYRVQNINTRWKNIKLHLERLASQMTQFESVQTSEGKKLKLDHPIAPVQTITVEAGQQPMDTDIRSTSKRITITKRTYKTASGEPIETHTTVSRVTSDETIPQGKMAIVLDNYCLRLQMYVGY